MLLSEPGRVWTVAEAKARALSEILRLAETEGPQRIGKRSSFVVVPERVWREHAPPDRMPMGIVAHREHAARNQSWRNPRPRRRLPSRDSVCRLG